MYREKFYLNFFLYILTKSLVQNREVSVLRETISLTASSMLTLVYSQTSLKGSPRGTYKHWMLNNGDPLIQVHLHSILV